MNISISIYRGWVNAQNDPPDRKQIAHEALDTYEKLVGHDAIERHELGPIVIAAMCPYRVAYDIGTEMLVRLASSNVTAQDVIREIVFNSHKVSERFRIIANLSHGLSREYTVELIRKALNDKGNRVREKAAEVADSLELKELLPDLDKRLLSENHPSAKRAIEFHAAMLRDGYVLKQNVDGSFALTVRKKNGWNNGWSGKTIKKEDIENGKLQFLIEKIQSQI